MAKTLVNLDEGLLASAMKATGLRRKVDVVNAGLRLLVAQRRILRLYRSLRGKVSFDVDPLKHRHGRTRPR
jgi:Arc/MetJ family transcription regulator